MRWSNARADALAQARLEAIPGSGTAGAAVTAVPISRLLLLRSTMANRTTVAVYADLLAAAYPARYQDLLGALSGTGAWPGAGLLWLEVDDGTVRLLDRPPRSIRLGR